MFKIWRYYNRLPEGLRNFIAKHRLLSKKKKGYMCMITFDWEAGLGGAPKVSVYSDLEELRKAHNCIDNCGIVEVEIVFKKVIKKAIPENPTKD